MKKITALLISIALVCSLTGCEYADISQLEAFADSLSEITESMNLKALGTDEPSIEEETEGEEELANEETHEDYSQGAPKWVWAEIKDNVHKDMPISEVDDYHLYVNRDWIADAQIPDGYETYSNYVIRQQEVEAQVCELLSDKSIKGNLAKSLQRLNDNILDWDSRDELGYEPLINDIDEINAIDNLDDLYDYLTDTFESYHEPLFDYYVSNDLEESRKNILYVDQISFILGDAAEYFEMSDSGQIRYDVYLEVFKYMMDRMGISGEDARSMYEDAIELESALAVNAYTDDDFCQSDIYDKMLNKQSVDQLCELCPDVRMLDILKAFKLNNAMVINVVNPDYISALNEILTEDNLDLIKNRMIVRKAITNWKYLDKQTYEDVSQIINDAYGLSGIVSDEVMAFYIVEKLMPIQLQQLYVQEYASESDRIIMEDMCREVIETYQSIIKESDYLSEDTKDAAIDKLNNITINASHPNKWPDVSALRLNGLSVYDAAKESSRFNTEYNLNKADKLVEKIMWVDIGGVSLLDTNAFYDPSENSINMVIGMMGEPFYSSDMSTEELYASLGAFWIGHEISHAFDLNGSQYDENGNLSDWWNNDDRVEYVSRASALGDYLSTIEVDDGQYVNGDNTCCEMLADITGLSCALEMAKNVEDFDYDLFFRKYAQINASISVEAIEKEMLAKDSHPLDYLRTNVAVQMFDEFYETYGVVEGDNMYLEPSKRVKLF